MNDHANLDLLLLAALRVTPSTAVGLHHRTGRGLSNVVAALNRLWVNHLVVRSRNGVYSATTAPAAGVQPAG